MRNNITMEKVELREGVEYADLLETRKAPRAFLKRLKEAEKKGFRPKGPVTEADLRSFEGGYSGKDQKIVSYTPDEDKVLKRAKNARREIEYDKAKKKVREQKEQDAKKTLIIQEPVEKIIFLSKK